METQVLKFAELMQAKLDKNKHKECAVMNPTGKGRGWHHCPTNWLIMRLLEEVVEMQKAIFEGESPVNVAKECADIANFAMMIADNSGGLE